PRLIFAGTPGFALESLRAMTGSGFRPLAVMTQPDRPAGRGRKLQSSPVKQFAVSAGIPVLQPESLRTALVRSQLAALQPDAIVVAAYGLLLPPELLQLPKQGCINVHASLLPRWRGAAPVQAAILAGDAETGISLMHMEEGLDNGPVYAQQALTIGAAESAGELLERLARLGGELLLMHLDAILAGELAAVPQDPRKVTSAGKLKPRDAWLDWRRPARELSRRLRACNPSPGAWFEVHGERVKCWSGEALESKGAAAGTVLSVNRDGVAIACGEGVIRLTSLQRPGRGRISGREFGEQLQLEGRRLST
ncbi:MAG: methionyl-tRNA formyltransferase, partial [Woeseia sp.]